MNCQYGGHGGSLLHTAVAEGDRKAATLLIAAGARFFLETIFLASMRGQFGFFLETKQIYAWPILLTNFVHSELTCRILTDELLFTLLLVWETRSSSFQSSHKYDARQLCRKTIRQIWNQPQRNVMSKKAGTSQPPAWEKSSFDGLWLGGGSTNPSGCEGGFNWNWKLKLKSN